MNMNAISNKRGFLVVTCLLSALAMTASAALIPASYDFGTDTGKETRAEAGFSTASNTGVTVTDELDSIRLEAAGGGVRRYANILKEYDNIGGSNTQDFTVTTTVEFVESGDYSHVRVGINLFSSGPSSSGVNGIWAAVNRDSSNNWTASLRGTGVATTTSDPLRTAPTYPAGSTADLEVKAEYLTGNNLQLTFTVNDSLGNSATVSSIVDRTDFENQYFGMVAGFRGSTWDFQDFAIIPEPTTMSLLGMALGSLLLVRRRFK